MRQTITRAIRAVRDYLARRQLAVAFLIVGLADSADSAGRAAVTALGASA